MNRRARNGRSVQWTPTQIVAFVIVVALLLVYVYARPALERRFGVKLPTLENSPKATDPTSPNLPAPTAHPITRPRGANASEKFSVKELPGRRFESPAGLIYGPSSEGNRIDHVMRHAVDDPDRPQQHGVFDVQDKQGVLMLLDEAYEYCQQKASNVSVSREGDRTVYTVNMGRRIGYVGGRIGKQKQFPACEKIILVLTDRNVITAYPVR